MLDSSVDVEANRVFNNPKVSQRFNELHSKLLQEAEKEVLITAKEVMKEIKDIAKDDIGNYLSFHEVNGDIELHIKDSDTICTKNISEISVGKNGQFKFKIYQRDKALFELARILGLYDKDNSLSNENAVDVSKLYSALEFEENVCDT